MTQVIYSVSSFFYAVPAMVLLCHFEAIVYSACGTPYVRTLFSVYSVLGFTQSFVSYMGDTYDARRSQSFLKRGWWNVIDVVHASSFTLSFILDIDKLCVSTCTGPEYTSSCFVNLYAYTATSMAFLMGGIYLSFFRLDVQNVYLLAWCHTLWHTFLPLGVTHTLYELGRRC